MPNFFAYLIHEAFSFLVNSVHTYLPNTELQESDCLVLGRGHANFIHKHHANYLEVTIDVFLFASGKPEFKH